MPFTPVDYAGVGPVYNVMKAGANGLGAADDTAVLAAAINAANVSPGAIMLGYAHLVTDLLPPITNNNIVFIGRQGPFNGGSRIIVDSPNAGPVFTFNGQYGGMQNTWVLNVRAQPSSRPVRLEGTYRSWFSNCNFNGFGGLDIVNCTLTRFDSVNLGDFVGPYGFFARGEGGFHNHAVVWHGSVCGTAFPLGGAVGECTNWAQNTAYGVGRVVRANGNLYQCAVAGTSSSSGIGPSGLPSALMATVHTTQIVDGVGTLRWVFAMPDAPWWRQGSFSHTFELHDCGALQGGTAVEAVDHTPGANSLPLFLRSRNLQVDHPYSSGLNIQAGASVTFEQVFITSVLQGNAINVGAAVEGFDFAGVKIFGANGAGVVSQADYGKFRGFEIAAIRSDRDGFEISGNAEHWQIQADQVGPNARYGVSIAAGCDNYIVAGNDLLDNVSGGVLNTPGVSGSRIVANNLGSVT